MDSPYIGAIFIWSGTFAPRGYLYCQGQELQIQQYNALYAILGVTYGGNGTSTFKLPDLRGRLPLCVNPTNPNFLLGRFAGTSSVPAHTHAAGFTGTGGGTQSLNIPATTGNLTVSASLAAGTTAAGTATPASGANYLGGMTGKLGTNSVVFTGPYSTTKPTGATLPADVTVTGNASTAAQTVNYNTGITGGSVAVAATGVAPTDPNVLPPYLALNFIIATEGLFPPRN